MAQRDGISRFRRLRIGPHVLRGLRFCCGHHYRAEGRPFRSAEGRRRSSTDSRPAHPRPFFTGSIISSSCCFHYVIFYFLYFAVCRTGGSASHFRFPGFQRGLAVVAEQTGRRDRHHLRNAQHFAGRQRRRPHCPLPQPLSAILGELLELFDDGQRICGRDGGYLRRMRRSSSVGRCRDRMHRRNRFRHRPFSARETGR